MYILGISALYHDSAAALIKDGEIVAAVQEERFTRIKFDARFPENSIRWIMQYAGIRASDIDLIAYYDDPVLTTDRFLTSLASCADDSDDLMNLSCESMFGDKLWIEKRTRELLGSDAIPFYVVKHHISHAASAFFPSPFENAAIITVDGVGEWNTTTIGIGKGSGLSLVKKIDYPHSLGLLYSAFTYFCGFRVNYGDYKLMGLAPYGEPIYASLIRDNLIDVKEDGSFRLNLDYFDYQYGRAMTNDRFARLFGGERRLPEGHITKREMDMAASIQAVIEDILLKLANTAKGIADNCENLCLAGGVALNCVANGKLLRDGPFENIWIQPAAGDAGGALGAALYMYYKRQGAGIRRPSGDIMKGGLLGPEFSNEDVMGYLGESGIPYKHLDDTELYGTVAQYLADGKVVGLYGGRMEYGPRALGNRSIIADPRSEDMQRWLNIKIKHRESFRPFAPAVLKERVDDYFDIRCESPYMLLVGGVKGRLDKDFNLHGYFAGGKDDLIEVVNRKRSNIPAVTHVDYSARIQTVSQDTNPRFYSIIKGFERLSGCGVVVNTSFNVRGEPIVCSPKDAYQCFMNTDMDVLVLENCVLLKEEQPLHMRRNDRYDPD